MSLNETPSSSRVHIGIFGCRNAGKSSLINALTGQNLAVVSAAPGTTTDPVTKAMELLPLGPVALIDTAGIDDAGELGALRVEKTRQVLRRADLALLVVDGETGRTPFDRELAEELDNRKIPYLEVYTKGDRVAPERRAPGFWVSAATGENITELKDTLAALKPADPPAPPLAADLVPPGSVAVLVVPIDSSAPKGRLILPQQQVIRDLLEGGASALVTGVDTLADTLNTLAGPPALVITDSQAFGRVAEIVPENMRLTSFSILFARRKGDLAQAVAGARRLKELKDGDRVLISEGCTHHRQCEDIGTVKLPRWIREHCGASPEFVFTSGTEFPDDLAGFRLIVHCGGCMLNAREMRYRYGLAAERQVPMTNYGIAIACMHGILDRAIAPLGL